jgi:uncharacterized membrane protein
VCHQLPSRTLEFGGKYLPMCARCSGIYLGVFASYAYLVFRRGFRVNSIPRITYSLIIAAFILPMAFDGATSYLGLRETTNALRLVTGTLAGSVLPIFAFPLLSPELILAEEKKEDEYPPFARWYDLLVWAAFVAVLLILSLQNWTWLYWPLSAFSTVGLVAIFFNLGLVVVEMVGERHRWARRPWSFLWAALIVTFIFSVLILLHKFAYDMMLDATGGVLPE